jgi:AraC-like DNA-binding protein
MAPGGDVLVLRARYRCQRFSRHAHEHYALGVIESGALAFRYRGEGLVAPAGHLSLAQPDVPHDGAPAGPDGWGYRMFYIPRQTLALLRPEQTATPHFRPGVLHDPALASLTAATHALVLDPAVPTLAKETRLLALLAAWTSRHAERLPPPRPVAPEPRAVRLTLERLDARYAEDIGLDELARTVGLSPWHLVRVLTRYTGLPPHAHLLDRRCRAARDLLAGPDRLADIAAATGFADQSHLTRAFRARFGLTPGTYRKIVQNSGPRPG